MAATANTSTDPLAPVRRRLVNNLLTQVVHNNIDVGDAHLTLDILELTGDRATINAALEARAMIAALTDHTLNPSDVDDTFTCSREQARDVLVDEFTRDYQDHVAALAAPRPAPAGRLPGGSWFRRLLDRVLCVADMDATCTCAPDLACPVHSWLDRVNSLGGRVAS